MSSFVWPGTSSGGVPAYANLASFPSAAASTGTLAIALDSGIVYESFGNAWVPIGSPTSIISIGTIDSQTPSANGAVDHSNQLIMQSASVSVPGLVNLTTQSFAGNKTFTGTISASNLSGTNTGDVTLAAFGSTPNANGLSLAAQVLNMQPADGTHPGGLSILAQTIAGSKSFADQALFSDGSDPAPGLAFVSEPGTGMFRPGTAAISLNVTGDQAFEALKEVISGTHQINLGFGGAASSSIGNALSANYSYNGRTHFNYANVSAGTSSECSLEASSGPGAGSTISIRNLAYANTSYIGGGGVLDADNTLSFLNIAAENSGAYIAFNVGGLSLATEAMRLGLSGTGLAINKGWNLTLAGSSSGVTTINAGSTGTYNFNLPVTAGTSGYALLSGGGSSSPMTWAAIVTNPMTTLGDLIYGGASGAVTRLAGDTSNTRKFLRELSVTSTATAPVWDTLASGDIPNNAANTSGTATYATNVAGGLGGSIPYQTAVNATSLLANGSANQYLASAGGTAAPAWTSFVAPTVQFFSGTLNYVTFTTAASTAAAGDTYTNNGATFTVIYAISSGTTLVCSYPSGSYTAPTSTLTRATGAGSATISYTAAASNGQYQLPTSPRSPIYLEVKVLGGGGGGAANGTSPGTAGNGVNSTFGTSLLTAGLGNGGSGSSPGTGGTYTVNSPAINYGSFNGATGYPGSTSNLNTPGGQGASSFAGGGGAGGGPGSGGSVGVTNTGSGGGGAGGAVGVVEGQGGGGASAYVAAIIGSPSATYTFIVGQGGVGGTAGSGGSAGGAGAVGSITVIEHYQ